MADDAIQSFCAAQKDLLAQELQSELDAASQEQEDRVHVLGNLKIHGVSVGLYGRTVVELGFEDDDRLLPAHRFGVGDEVEVRGSGQHSSRRDFPGGVISMVSDKSISLALFSGNARSQMNSTVQNGDDDEEMLGLPPFSLVPKSSAEVHRKMVQALDDLARQGADHPICGRVVQSLFAAAPEPLGKSPQIKIENRKLDHSQIEAISFALQEDRPVALIHGPPGTGKTTTVVELIRQAVSRGMKCLVTAPSNVAVDNILERLVPSASLSSKKGKQKRPLQAIRCVRLGHPARIQPSIVAYSLESLVQRAEGTEIVNDVRSELQMYLKVLQKSTTKGNERRAAYREIKNLRKEVRVREEKVVQELISNAQVVLATTIGAANRILDRQVPDGFDLVIIDEAAQALEASCVIPMMRGKKLILAGDHCQLPPTIKSNNPKVQSGLSITMFERLMQLYGGSSPNGSESISRMLRVQYRMNKMIADWASGALYNGMLLTDESVGARTLRTCESVSRTVDVEDAILDIPMLLIDTAGCDMYESATDAGSKFNEGEAKIVIEHVRLLLSLGLAQKQVAVITPYNGQVEVLKAGLHADFPHVEIRSVDGFQGGEREAVVLSMVRSSERGGMNGIGFLKDSRRLNVAVTRAMSHVAVVCDTETVCQDTFIGKLVSHIEANGTVRSAMREEHDSSLETDIKYAELNIEKLLKPSGKGGAKKHCTTQPVSKSMGQTKLDETGLQALRERISSFLEKAKPGVELVLPPDLTSADRRFVHELCEQVGAKHESRGTDGIDRELVITQVRANNTDSESGTYSAVAVDATIISSNDEEREAALVQAPVVTSFSALSVESGSDEEGGTSESNNVPQSSNELLGQLARERAKREDHRRLAEQKPSSAVTNKKKSKNKGRKLGGSKKPVPKEENLDHLDDMAFLDTQIEKAQNSHGRTVAGSGKGYKTIVNGILNSRPPLREDGKKNKQASAALKAKLKNAEESRKAKRKKK